METIFKIHIPDDQQIEIMGKFIQTFDGFIQSEIYQNSPPNQEIKIEYFKLMFQDKICGVQRKQESALKDHFVEQVPSKQSSIEGDLIFILTKLDKLHQMFIKFQMSFLTHRKKRKILFL
jgi:hypothetical protein